MNKRTLIITVIAFAAILIAAVLLYNDLAGRVSPETNLPAPGFDAESLSPGTEESTSEISGTDSEAEKSETLLVPDFTIADSEGNEIMFSDFRGKPVVLNFWASWCPPCKQEMPEFEKVYQELGRDVQFLMLALTDGGRETKETASSFIEEQGYSFPVFYDVFREGAILFGIQSIPTTFFINSDGYLVDYIIGMLDEAALRTGIENL